MILRLRNIKNHYNEHIEALFVQAHEWCDSCSASVFVPLSSWISAMPSMTITVLPCVDGAFKIAPTTFNQHVFCTTRSNEIAMYHIPSKKLVKKFTGIILFKSKDQKKKKSFLFRSYIIDYIYTINT
jgi:hypothetical protein